MLNQKYDLSPKSNKKRLEMLNQKYKNEKKNNEIQEFFRKKAKDETIDKNTLNSLIKTANFGNNNNLGQSTNSILQDIIENLSKRDRKDQEKIRDYLRKNKDNLPITIKEDLSEFSDEKLNKNNKKNENQYYDKNNDKNTDKYTDKNTDKYTEETTSNLNYEDNKNLLFDNFSEIESRRMSRQPSIKENENERKSLNEEEICNLSVDLSGEKNNKRKISENENFVSFNFERKNSDKNSNYNKEKTEEEIIFEKMNFFGDSQYGNFGMKKSKKEKNKNNDNIENELKESEMLRDSFGEKVLRDLRNLRAEENEKQSEKKNKKKINKNYIFILYKIGKNKKQL